MKIFKFRYADADGKPYFKEIALPNDAAQLVGFDCDGREVYSDDVVIYNGYLIEMCEQVDSEWLKCCKLKEA